MDLQFRTVPSLVMEFGAARRLGSLLRERFPQRRLCLVTDGFLARSGVLEPCIASLESEQWQVCVIDDVVADPPDHVVKQATRKAIDFGAELVLGLGGGSSLDVAKLIAVLAVSDQQLEDMYGIGKVTGQRLPLVQVPTTAGTGSEVTPISIVTTATTKLGVVAPQLYADLALLDAELTLGLPPAATAATGIDAMVHAIEAYTTRLQKNPLSDMLAREALRLLSRSLLPVCADGTNRQAREDMLLGATLAGQAFANAPVGAVHALAYPVGSLFHVAHGLSNSLVLPHVMRFNLEQAAGMYSELAKIIMPDLPPGPATGRAQALADHMEELARRCAIPMRLRDVGIGAEDLPNLAAEAMKQTRLLTNNPRALALEDARAIYQAAY